MAALAADNGVSTAVGCRRGRHRPSSSSRSCSATGASATSSPPLSSGSLSRQHRGPGQRLHARQDHGANILTIAVGHSLDILGRLLGELADLSALTGLRRPLLAIEEAGEQIGKTAPDQVAVIGTLTSGAAASVREAVAGGTGFLWDLNGTQGSLRMTADAAYPEIFPLTVAGARGTSDFRELALPAGSPSAGPRQLV